MIVKRMRERRGWTQEQLAEMSGLSVRTIQRLEKGNNVDMESLKSLAAVFETDISELKLGGNVSATKVLTVDHQQASRYVKIRRIFRTHLAAYLFVELVLIATTLLESSTTTRGFTDVIEVGAGWGIAVLIHFVYTLKVRADLFNAEWETNSFLNDISRDDQ